MHLLDRDPDNDVYCDPDNFAPCKRGIRGTDSDLDRDPDNLDRCKQGLRDNLITTPHGLGISMIIDTRTRAVTPCVVT